MMEFIGKLLLIDDLKSIESWSIDFAAPWAEGRPALVIFASLALAACAFFFYWRLQDVASKKARAWLASSRAVILVLLLLVLAQPVLTMALAHQPRPLLVVLVDGTDSMNMQDRLSDDAIKAITKLTGDIKNTKALEESSRLELVRKVLTSEQLKVFEGLSEKYRIRAYALDRLDQVREIESADDDADDFDIIHVAEQLKAEGKVTALGAAMDDLARRHRSHLLAGVVVLSDFDQNAGRPAISAAQQLGVPLYTIGLGPREVVDLSVDLKAPLDLKADEDVSVTVHVRQTGLTGRAGRVQLLSRRLGGGLTGSVESAFVPVAPPKTVAIDSDRFSFDIAFRPSQTGRYVLQAKFDPFDDEVLQDNNTAEREINVRDEFLKLLYVEYEPTWEWRFVKEVFHRDPLIGREGFRTFLRSADFKVRRTNEMFLETLVRPRSEFFAYDVIFLSDVPNEMLPDHFQDMLVEYVKNFGGGLVVLTGPRFGAGALANTKIGDMLPVVLDPTKRARIGDFSPRLTPEAADQDFMMLGKDERENLLAWKNLGRLPWYQPVARKHPLATVLATHPTDRCVDGQTPQPLIAVRRYGKGEVIYMGFNEMWRLRRKYGEKYYRQFWGQMIYRLGLGRALGSQKRFQVYTDRPTYQAGDKVRITVEAFNQNFEPLEDQKLNAKLIAADATQEDTVSELSIPLSRDKVIFETTVPVYAAGPHRLLVRDPVTREEIEVNFKVAPVTAERRNAVRDYDLQMALANQTGGKFYELHEITSLGDDLRDPDVTEITVKRKPLWSTWLVLGAVLVLMMTEWIVRKLVNLR